MAQIVHDLADALRFIQETVDDLKCERDEFDEEATDLQKRIDELEEQVAELESKLDERAI